ncbi:AAA family ATPase [Endozoicomonas sp. ALC020]|uniref:AAA family ATPase n=1 Tax=unclassified Endozoicomonas TaxID=2644528 RepID=UPI003BAFEC70
MDGQIGGEITPSFCNNGVSHNGMPTGRSQFGSPPKIEGINPVVTVKAYVSSTSMTLSDRAGTLSSTNSSQAAPYSFDFCFVANDDEVRQLLAARTGDEGRDVILISHPDDLSQANLVSRLSIAADGCHTLSSGKLFEGSKPLTLVMDIRKLTSDELPKFNDLLDPDNPCLYDKVSQKKRPLGEHVSLLVLASPAQLASVGQSYEAPAAGALGADFWRRINRPENTWWFDAQTSNDPSMNIDKIPPVLTEFPAESVLDESNTVLIDCHLHNNWRQLLLGGPGVDQQGRIRHLPGRLESLKAGQRVILKGANWQDLAFEQTIRQMLVQQCFESNGNICPLPDNVQFYQMPVGNDELRSLFQSLSCSCDREGDTEGEKGLDKEQAPGNPIIINQGNINEWLSPIAIAPDGHAAPNTCLLEQVQAGGVVTVTSPLSEALWFRLLGSLQRIREKTGLQPGLQVAHSKRQPKVLGLAENDEYPLPIPLEKTRNRAAFETVTYQQHAQASHWINNHQPAPLVIQVNEQTGFSQLFDNIHITSEQKAHFGRSQSELQKALTAGKPVVFLGLESNPTLQHLLEPLAAGQPLVLNGQLQAYPQAHVTLLWPESAKSPSSVFNSLVTTGKRCPEVDLWAINGDKHHIPGTELPEQAVDKLYKAFKTVPVGLKNSLPVMTEGLLNNLILAARRAKQVDQSAQLLPCHWRKAINSVITHGTRQHPTVRDFMKVACWHLLPDKTPDENQTASIDPDHLNAIINNSLRLDREFVKQNLWSLARAFDPAVFNEKLQLSYKSPFSEQNEKEVLDNLCTMIVAHAPEEKRDAMAYQLEVDPAASEPCQSLAVRPTKQIKRLQDALACGWQLTLPLGQTRSDAIQVLASDCFHIARTANSRTEGIERVEQRLSESLKWNSSFDKPLSALARDLYHGETSQKDRESRRLSRLHDRLTDSPVIFLEGETGTGKSYFSTKMARASGQAKVISLGPSDSEQTLMKRWQWQQHADGDRSMVQQNRALMEWAKTESDKDGGCVGKEYITLVLDEANLAKTGLLASLNGLWETQPCIYVNGHPVRVSKKHRVILTGNPDHYSGRQMDLALKEKLPRAYYPRLDQAFLRDRVVEPTLVRHLQRHLPEQQINDIAHSASKSVMALWQYYQELLPEHEFTPRDLTDICSWVGWYLDRALSKGDSVNCEQLNSLIRQSFRDLLGPEISETQQDALSALEIWFAARYHPNNTLRDRVHNHTLPDILQDFRTLTKEIRPEFDTSGSAVIELVQQLGQDLSRSQQAYHHDRKHGGRQATLIEGPAGRGKDATLNLVIESVRKQAKQRGESMPEVFLLNACDCSWDKVCEAIQKAKVDGGIVVISEMNLIDSQHLEGELNDILAGDAHPGFHLFATINPPECSGRKPLSPALKGRFRHLPIRQYSSTELQTIAEKVLPANQQGKIVAKRLTEKHCRLRTCLQRKDLPLQPTSRDLQNVAMAVNRKGDFSKKALRQCFNQHYRLYLMAAKLSLEELPDPSAIATSNSELDSGLCKWLNQTISDIDRPWLIRRSYLNSTDEKRHEMLVDADLNAKEARTEIIKRLAQARWRASGLSLKPDESDDILTQALYRHWQQRWFNRNFCQTGMDANSVFPLSEEQEQTLKLSASQPYLQDAEQRIAAWNDHDVKLWPAFWHQMGGLENLRVDGCSNQVSAVGGDNAPEPYNPEVHENQAPTLDRTTDYECQEIPQLEDYKIFETESPSHMYRWWAKDIYVSAEGEVKEIDLNDKDIDGFENLIPARLPGPDQQLKLTRDQTLATFNWISGNGRHALPSLTVNDYIVALRLKPDVPFTLVRNQYTGLHTLSVNEVQANQRIHVAYVVESRKPGKKTPAKGTRPERSTWFDSHCSEGIKTVLDELFAKTDHPSEVKTLLRKIKSPINTLQRIRAITDYCRLFSGKLQPERHENFFKFLVTQRQGHCLHRVPVFIAFCRYFGIPCRNIQNAIHSFAEYSLDDGQTWKSVDLGGAPSKTTEILYAFQPNRKISCSSDESKKIEAFLKGIDLAQKQALAKTLGVSLEELNKALEENSALLETHSGNSEIVKSPQQENNLAGFLMGVSMLETLETKALVDQEMDFKLMREALMHILCNSVEYQVIERLKSIYATVIDQAEASSLKWIMTLLHILQDIDITRPSAIHLALGAMKLGWLDPVHFDNRFWGFDRYHQIFVRLEGVDELKVKAADCLKKWYKYVFFGRKSSPAWRLAYRNFREREGDALLVTHCHNGFSQSFEDIIIVRSLRTGWSNEPEGMPNIERMLMHSPAFPKLISGKANHRPVIIMGQPSWNSTVINERVEALLQQKVENSQELSRQDQKLLDDSRARYRQAIQQAFSHYLYEVTHSKGGSLTYCWVDATVKPKIDDPYKYGARDPSSPKQLYAMMSEINSSSWFQEYGRDAYLRQAFNDSNALILKSGELTKIAEEFLNSVNLNSLYESLDTH